MRTKTEIKKEQGAKGGKTVGKTKSRPMMGVEVGRRSAGRANKNYSRPTKSEDGYSMKEIRNARTVYHACVEWLTSHGVKQGFQAYPFGKRGADR